MPEQDNNGKDNRLSKNDNPPNIAPEPSDWDAFSNPPPFSPDAGESVNPEEVPPGPGGGKGKSAHFYMLVSIILLLLLIAFVAWVWVSDHFGISLFGGENPASSLPSTIESAASMSGESGGWVSGGQDGSNSVETSNGGGAGGVSGDESASGESDESDGLSSEDVDWVPGRPASEPSPSEESSNVSSEVDTSGFDIVIAYPDGTTSPEGKPRPDGAASLPEIPTKPTDQDAVNESDYEAPINTPFSAMMDPSNFLNKSFFIDITYRDNSALYLEFVSDIMDPADNSFRLESGQAAAISNDMASREYHNGVHYEYLTSNPLLQPGEPSFADMLNVTVYLYDLHSDTPETPVVIDKEADGVTPLTLQYIIDQSDFESPQNPSEGILLCRLPKLGDDMSAGIRSYRVRIGISVNPKAGNEYQGGQLGGDFVWSLKISDEASGEPLETVARSVDAGGNTNRGGGYMQNLANPKAVLYIPAWNLSITLEMIINFVIATLLCFGFLVLIAKSRKMNEEFIRNGDTPFKPPSKRDSAKPRGRPPEKMSAAASAKSGLDTAAYQRAAASRGKQIKSQMKSSLVFILILISLLVGFTVAAVTWKVQAPVIDNAILGTTIKPIIYAGDAYIANTGDSAVKIPIFNQEVLDVGGEPYLVKEFHILNTGTSEFQYRVYLSDFTNQGTPIEASSPSLSGITASIYLDGEEAKDKQNPIYSAPISEFIRSDKPFTEADLDGNGMKQLVLPPMVLGQNVQKNDQRYYMRLDFPDTFVGMQLGFTVEVEAIQTSGSPGFEVLDRQP